MNPTEDLQQNHSNKIKIYRDEQVCDDVCVVQVLCYPSIRFLWWESW